MNQELRCYRCGHSLSALLLPLSRRDECPQCTIDLHVCRMCRYYDPGVPDACTEDDALQVTDKARANFCDYFKPSSNVYSPVELDAELAARASLGALFGDEKAPEASASAATEDPIESAADALFKK